MLTSSVFPALSYPNTISFFSLKNVNCDKNQNLVLGPYTFIFNCFQLANNLCIKKVSQIEMLVFCFFLFSQCVCI